MALYMHYSLVFMLATASLVAQNDSQDARTVQQEEVQPQDDSNQPKSFWNRCYEKRRDILAIAIGTLCAAAILACIYRSSKTTSFSIEITPSLPQGDAQIGYLEKYSEASKKHIETLKSIHPVFETIFNGEWHNKYDCDLAIRTLEKIYNGDKYAHRTLAQVAGWTLNKTVIDPIERLNAQKQIARTVKHAVRTLCPVAVKQAIANLNPISDSWDYFYGFLAGG